MPVECYYHFCHFYQIPMCVLLLNARVLEIPSRCRSWGIQIPDHQNQGLSKSRRVCLNLEDGHPQCTNVIHVNCRFGTVSTISIKLNFSISLRSNPICRRRYERHSFLAHALTHLSDMFQPNNILLVASEVWNLTQNPQRTRMFWALRFSFVTSAAINDVSISRN